MMDARKPSRPDPPSAYQECRSCGRIMPVPDKKAVAPDRACSCGSRGPFLPWPSTPVVAMLERSLAQGEGGDQLSVAVICLCTAVQLLLERAVAELLAQNAGSTRTIELVMNRGVDTLIKFYGEVRGQSLDATFARAGAAGLGTDIEALFALRAKIVRDGSCSPRTDEKHLLHAVRAGCLNGFAFIHNDLRDVFSGKTVTKRGVRPGRCILIVDDEQEAAHHVARFVERQGFAALVAGTGAEAVTLFERNRPACVFLDVAIPDMPGQAVLQRMRQIDPGTRAYFVTGIGGEAFRKEARQLGAAGCISKPADVNDLLRVIQSLPKQ